MAKKTYYDIADMWSTQAQYMLLLGQRANGKSYQAKMKVLENAYKNNEKFVYLRRWDSDIKASMVRSYFDDMPISKITNGEWDSIYAYGGNIHFQKTIEGSTKTEKSMPIGKYCALNLNERYKSTVFKNTTVIIFEEFITDKIYLNNEPTTLQHFVSTVFRLGEGHVIMVGNTLSRVCPYFAEWQLEGTLTQKQGTIDVYHFHTLDNNVIDVAVEYCTNINNGNRMFFGQAAKQITTGQWDTKEAPKLPKEYEEYVLVYEALIKYNSFKFVMQLLIDTEEDTLILYVYPHTTLREIKRVLTPGFSDKRFVSPCLDLTIYPETLIRKCIKEERVCFSDNLTAADFNTVMKNFAI